MHVETGGKPSFTYMTVTLEAGERIVAESDAMASMDADIAHDVKFNGGFFKAIFRRALGGESFFINHFINEGAMPKKITLTQASPGDIVPVKLNDSGVFMQPGAFVFRTPGIDVELKWAGFRSFFAREGLFRLYAHGTGTVWLGAYGHIFEKEIDGEYLIDTSHIVAYGPELEMRLQLSGGLISSLTSGEGLLTRMSGKGKVLMQSRSIGGLASFLNPRI